MVDYLVRKLRYLVANLPWGARRERIDTLFSGGEDARVIPSVTSNCPEFDS